MKKIFTLLSLLCFTSLVFSQVTLVADQSSVLMSGVASDFDIIGHISITNTSSSTSTFTWVRDEASFIDGWASGVCDKNQCYARATSTETFELVAGETGNMDMHLYPEGSCGDGFAEVTVTDDNDPTNFVVLTFEFNATPQDGRECELTNSVTDFKLDYVKVYPNPASDFFTLTDVPADLELIQIYNILGTKVKTFTASQNANYDISNLNEGLYLVNLTNAKGENLNTIKLHKN